MKRPHGWGCERSVQAAQFLVAPGQNGVLGCWSAIRPWDQKSGAILWLTAQWTVGPSQGTMSKDSGAAPPYTLAGLEWNGSRFQEHPVNRLDAGHRRYHLMAR